MTSPSLENATPRGLKRTVAPTIQAISLSAFKSHHHIDHDDDDATILDYIEAATDYAENVQERSLRSSTWQAVYDGFPASGVFYVPRPPLIGSVVLTYLDSSGASQTLSSSYYVVDSVSEPARVSLAYGYSWPTTYGQLGAVTLQFVAGHSSAAAIPSRTRQAIRMLVSHWYENKEPIVVGQPVANVPFSVNDLLNEDRFVSYR